MATGAVCLPARLLLAFSTTLPAVAAQKQKQSDLGTILKAPSVDKSEPMLLQADEMIYDNENNRVTAKGNVEIYYGNYTLLADQVIYDRNANTLAAQGNVRIKDPDGAIITSNQMTLTDDFRDGFIDALRVVTKDDTRIVAQTASREAGNVTVFHNGWFTPCKPCEENPDKPPTWRIRAKTIIHRKDEATITYRNGFFDFFGVPIIWLPYFQSADPTVKRKSGFLMPMYAQSDRLGTTVTVPYYFALSDHYDFTFAPMYTSQQGVLWQGDWRHRLASGGYRVEVAGVFNDGTFAFPKDVNSDFRGSVVTEGKFALNPYWSWGWDAIAASDDTFRRFYGLESEIKTDQISQLYLEGLHDRNYFGMKFYQTNNLLSSRDPLADATVYPIIDYDYILKNPIIGGEVSFNSNVMALSNADGTDSNRLIVEANWRRQMIDGIGEVFTPFARIRGDLYGVNEFVDPETDLNSSGALGRGVAVGGAEYRYPFIATTGSVAHVFEPIGQIIGRPEFSRHRSVGDSQRGREEPRFRRHHPVRHRQVLRLRPHRDRHPRQRWRALHGAIREWRLYSRRGWRKLSARWPEPLRHQQRSWHQVLRLCDRALHPGGKVFVARGAGAFQPRYVRSDAHRSRRHGERRPGRHVVGLCRGCT